MRKRTIVKPKVVADTGSGSVQKEEYSVKVIVCMVGLPRFYTTGRELHAWSVDSALLLVTNEMG